jgi:ABC-type sugar transport system ATPase subunit
VEGCVWDVTFTLHRGEILGLAGLGGSGRTTICRALVGLADVDTGEIRLEGRRAPRNPAAAARHGVVLVPEDRKAHGLVMGQSVAFNITLPWLESIARLRVLLAGREEAPLVEKTITRFQVRPPSRDLPVENLSGGNQQKVVLGKWLLTNPKVVVLDEPTRGIDVGAKAEIYAIMKQLSQQGVGIIVASSELPELLGTCDRILVLHEGRIKGEFLRGEFSEEAILHCAIGATSEDEPEGEDHG